MMSVLFVFLDNSQKLDGFHKYLCHCVCTKVASAVEGLMHNTVLFLYNNRFTKVIL